MKIMLNEITDVGKSYDFSEEESWILESVEKVDEKDESKQALQALKPKTFTKKKRPVSAHFELRRVDDVIVVSGHLEASIELLCSRCATHYAHSIHPRFTALFCKDPNMAGVVDLQKNPAKRPTHVRHGTARTGTNLSESESEDIDISHLTEDHIDLSEIVTEQLQLQVPFQPLCKESCRGICPQCGADLNLGRCACKQTQSSSPFSILKDMKIGADKRTDSS